MKTVVHVLVVIPSLVFIAWMCLGTLLHWAGL